MCEATIRFTLSVMLVAHVIGAPALPKGRVVIDE